MIKKAYNIYLKGLKAVIFIFLGISAIGIIAMISVTCLDVICRILRIKFVGSYDIVKLTGAVAMTCALPYTTALKGHVAIEYFFHKLSKRGRIVVDTFARFFAMCFFILLTVQSLKYGKQLFTNNVLTPTLQIPTFWIPYVISVSCMIVVLVILHNIINPGKAMIKP